MKMPKVSFTYEEAVQLLEKAVADRGADYVYAKDPKALRTSFWRCVNVFVDGTPGCIIGQILAYKGFWDQEGAALYEGTVTVSDLIVEGVIEADDATAELLSAVQRNQDNGVSWGEAVSRARMIAEAVRSGGCPASWHHYCS
jgi:hypothetical protein